MQGFRDYRVVNLLEIIEDLKEDYLPFTSNTVKKLFELRKDTEEYRGKLNDANEIISYINYCIPIFEGIGHDLSRVIDEIIYEVEVRHLDIFNQIYEQCLSDYKNREFKKEFMPSNLGDGPLRNHLGSIYSASSNGFFHFLIFSDINTRLRTYIGTKLQKRQLSKLDKSKEKGPLFKIPEGKSWGSLNMHNPVQSGR